MTMAILFEAMSAVQRCLLSCGIISRLAGPSITIDASRTSSKLSKPASGTDPDSAQSQRSGPNQNPAPSDHTVKLTRARLLLIAFVVEGVVFGLALLLAYWMQIELNPAPNDLARELIIGLLATVPLVVLFVATMSEYGDRSSVLSNLKRIMLQDIRRIFIHARFFDLVAIAAAAGVAEEMLFRGILQPQLGLLPASVLFGLVHFVTPTYAVAATLMGIYIGLVFSVFESLFAVILLHALYDLYALMYIRYQTAETRFDR